MSKYKLSYTNFPIGVNTDNMPTLHHVQEIMVTLSLTYKGFMVEGTYI